MKDESANAKNKGLPITIIVLAVIALLIVTGAAAWYLYAVNHKTASAGCSSTGSGGVLQQAITSISNAGSLKPVADKITQLRDYQKDPNCLYILAGYYSQTGDATNTQKYMQLMRGLPSNQQPSALLVNSNDKNLQALKAQIDFRLQFNTQAIHNFVGTGSPQ